MQPNEGASIIDLLLFSQAWQEVQMQFVYKAIEMTRGNVLTLSIIIIMYVHRCH